MNFSCQCQHAPSSDVHRSMHAHQPALAPPRLKLSARHSLGKRPLCIVVCYTFVSMRSLAQTCLVCTHACCCTLRISRGPVLTLTSCTVPPCRHLCTAPTSATCHAIPGCCTLLAVWQHTTSKHAPSSGQQTQARRNRRSQAWHAKLAAEGVLRRSRGKG